MTTSEKTKKTEAPPPPMTSMDKMKEQEINHMIVLLLLFVFFMINTIVACFRHYAIIIEHRDKVEASKMLERVEIVNMTMSFTFAMIVMGLSMVAFKASLTKKADARVKTD